MNLDIICKSCKVSKYCPDFGTAPLKYQNHLIPCQVVGGFGRTEIPSSKISSKSLPLYETNGKCVSFILVPWIDEVGNLQTSLKKIFHPPILHPREKTDVNFKDKFDPNNNY